MMSDIDPDNRRYYSPDEIKGNFIHGVAISFVKKPYLLILLLPIALMLPGITGFPYPSQDALYSDLAISHYPNAIFFRRAIQTWGVVPLWSPTILSGYPFAADPLSGLWYPPGWLALLVPLPFGFNLLAALHMLWGGVGAYFLFKHEGRGSFSSLFGALAFECLPKLFTHYGAGHLTLLYAVYWTPWLFLAEARRLSDSGAGGHSRKLGILRVVIQPGVIIAVIFLGDPRWAAYAGFAWLGYIAVNKPFPKIRYVGLQILLSALLAAPLGVPLFEYTRLSTRADMIAEEVLAYSLPIERSLGFIFPDLGGYQEWMVYPGGMILVLVCAGLFVKDVRKKSKVWLWMGLVSLFFSLGSHVPGMVFLARLPVLNLLRVPSRSLFLTGFALIAIATTTLDQITIGQIRKEARGSVLSIFGIVVFTLALASGVRLLTAKLPLNFAWGVVSVSVSAIWVFAYLSRWLPLGLINIGIILIASFDWGGVNLSSFAQHPADAVINEKEEVARFIQIRSEISRVYSPSYSLPQQTAALHGLELADGVNPLQLKKYVNFMTSATGVPSTGYSVTLPPFVNDDPSRENSAFHPDPFRLGLLNIRFVVAEFDLSEEGLALQARFGATRVYENLEVRPRAWVQSGESDFTDEFTPAQIISWEPNQIEINATGPGELVLSEIYYPGWRVYVDNKPESMLMIYDLLRGVRLDTGLHHVTFVFLPLSVYIGLVCWVLGITIVLIKGRSALN